MGPCFGPCSLKGKSEGLLNGALSWSPYKQDHSLLGFVLGPRIYGSPDIARQRLREAYLEEQVRWYLVSNQGA